MEGGLQMEIWLMSISTFFMAAATIVIAISAYMSYRRDKKFQQQLSDLYQGIVVATVLSGPTNTLQTVNARIAEFKNNYKGKTEIFPERKS